MREILFRGKRISDGEWIYGSLMHRTKYYGSDCDDYFIITDGEFDMDYYFAEKVIPETIGQYTGLIDDTGDKVFEGDIVKGMFSDYDGETVYFEEVCEYPVPTFYNFAFSLTAIGNVSDNPELLKGGTS